MNHQADAWHRIIDESRSRVFRRMIKNSGAIFDGQAASSIVSLTDLAEL